MHGFITFDYGLHIYVKVMILFNVALFLSNPVKNFNFESSCIMFNFCVFVAKRLN